MFNLEPRKEKGRRGAAAEGGGLVKSILITLKDESDSNRTKGEI